MEIFVFRHSDYLGLYNCSPSLIKEMEHFYEFGDPSTPSFHLEAWITIFISILAYCLYIPCICVIWKYAFTQSCYLLLLYIGFTDLLIICICGFLQGWLELQRASFCMYPNLIYFAGMFGVCKLLNNKILKNYIEN